ncbi:MAG: rhomboid family intramembrane serine protease [Paludibacteraceae bacterium]|nr:rhomboid family intramembrane serine protease [Paludibacteraceae bacterium]
MDFVEKIKQLYRQGDALTRLIFLNVAVFVVLQIFIISFRLFNVSGSFILSWVAVPAGLYDLMYRPWTIISYMFLHEKFFHILFNMFALYWFGKLFQMYFNDKQLVALYLLGGIGGAAFYVLAYNIFPLFAPSVAFSILLGASGSVMAIILAVAMRAPDMQLRLMFLGSVKLKYIALFAVLASLFGITSENAGGEIAHLGGALVGYIFVVSLRSGKDITRGLNRFIDLLTGLFKPRKMKVKKGGAQAGRKMTDAEFNMSQARRMEDIDRILDKIKTSGYESLTAEEKKRLFDQSKN